MLYRRLAAGTTSDSWHASELADDRGLQIHDPTECGGPAKQIVLVLVFVLDCPVSDYENEDDDEDERFAPPETKLTDTYRIVL